MAPRIALLSPMEMEDLADHVLAKMAGRSNIESLAQEGDRAGGVTIGKVGAEARIHGVGVAWPWKTVNTPAVLGRTRFRTESSQINRAGSWLRATSRSPKRWPWVNLSGIKTERRPGSRP